jgi:hypothetical protein
LAAPEKEKPRRGGVSDLVGNLVRTSSNGVQPVTHRVDSLTTLCCVAFVRVTDSDGGVGLVAPVYPGTVTLQPPLPSATLAWQGRADCLVVWDPFPGGSCLASVERTLPPPTLM